MASLPSLGSKAPDFKANTTSGPIKLSDYTGKWVVLFSHPGDFTPVCTTEFLCFTKYYDEFKKLNAEAPADKKLKVAWLQKDRRILHL